VYRKTGSALETVDEYGSGTSAAKWQRTAKCAQRLHLDNGVSTSTRPASLRADTQ